MAPKVIHSARAELVEALPRACSILRQAQDERNPERKVRFPLLAGIALAGWLAQASAESSLELKTCQLDSTLVRGDAEARCGWFEVAENREAADSPKIRIHVAVIPAMRKQPLPDPLFLITGGPGQAASDFYLSSSIAFDRLRSERDIVVIDQRGTGKSHAMHCKLPDEFESAAYDKSLNQRFAQDCLQQLSGDPRYYSTSVAVRDLDEIRAALGYAKINVYGVSYGTRVAQHYARRYPQHLRTMTLDGVVPVEEALGPMIAIHAQQALEDIFERCLKDEACNTAFPNIATTFANVRDELKTKPMSVVIPDPRTAKPTSIDVTAAHLAVALRLHSYSDDTASLLPFLIHETSAGRAQMLAAQALLVSRNMQDQMAMGMQFSVMCSEDVPFYKDDAKRDAEIAASYMSTMLVDSLRSICEIWPRAVIDEDFHAPLKSEVPTLLLSGESDPATAASFGEQTLKSYSQGKHIVFAGQGHGQLQSRCGVSLIRRFIEQGTVTALDESCVADVMPAPFMIDANGPRP